MYRAAFRSVLDFCVPRICPACRVPHESDSIFCPRCEEDFVAVESAPRCRFCSMPVTLPGAPCAQCLGNGLPPFDQIVSLGVLKDPLKSAIHRVKYNHQWALADRLADRLMHCADVRAMLEIAEVLVPVPLHRTRQRERGFNQAEMIARRIAGYKGLFKFGRAPRVIVANAAVRIRATETQTHLSRTKRAENLRDAFVLTDLASLEDKHIVLVDDVMTTGATLVSFARTLKNAKPASLSVILLAVADPKGREFEVI